MQSLSRLSSKCAKCTFANKCKHKKMEHEAYMQPASAEMIAPVLEQIAVKHDYRDVKVAPNTTITIDLEEIKKQLERDFYRSAGIGLDYGA